MAAAALSALCATVILAPAAALACGAFFASQIEVSADQKIVVVHRGGVETYVFRPHFCGAAKDFGVILPIPAALAGAPALADNALFDQLDTYTKPQIVEVCQSSGGIGCGAATGGDKGLGLDAGNGANVIDRGRVGIFEYVVIQATTVAAFTDWLDQNGFPHGTATDAFQHYVTKQWYFVAFKVSADTTAPPAGQKLCGDLGPIQLSFASNRPIVPSRITSENRAVGSSPTWRVALVAPAQQKLDTVSGYGARPYFSGTLSQSDLSANTALGALARDGDRLTVLDVDFTGASSDDIQFVDDPSPADYRTTLTVQKRCPTTCSTGGQSVIDLIGVALLFAVLALLRRVHRQPT